MTQSSNDRMGREPDYDAVLAAEFDNAVAQGTREALIRFISRHPGSAPAARAFRLLDGGTGLPLKGNSYADPDADVYAAFDEAYRAGGAAALDAFIARYAPHPLAEEAKRLRRGTSPESR